jgi:hypothetical protein
MTPQERERPLSGKMCIVPDPEAVLCGRCHGEWPTFSARRKARIKKRWAHDHLGCTGTTEVIGPYVPGIQAEQKGGAE